MTMTATPARPAVPPLRPAARGMPAYTQTLALVPGSVRIARLSVRTTVSCWGLDALTDDAVVIVSELVTNAVQFAARPVVCLLSDSGQCRLTVERPAPHRVRISVSDSSATRLVRRNLGVDGESGRGLVVVDAYAARWDVDQGWDRKTVWAELEATP